MYKIKFTIKKESLFISWLQMSSDFNKNEYAQLFLKRYGKFNKDQELALRKFSKILFKRNNGYNLLYDLYKHKEIKNTAEKEKFENIKKELDPFFEKVWEGEILNLRKKKEVLEKYNLSKINNFIECLEKFTGKTICKTICVQLFFSKHKKVSGATHKNANSFSVLFCSHSDFRYKKDIMLTITHEITHLFLYTIDDKLKESFKKVFSDIDLKKYKKDFTIRDTVHEIITVAICGGYLFSGYFSKTYLKMDQVKQNIKDERSGFIFSVAEKIYPMTKEYLKKGKTVDSDYADFVLEEIKKGYLK